MPHLLHNFPKKKFCARIARYLPEKKKGINLYNIKNENRKAGEKMKMKMINKKEEGFTLVELLLVIAIIGILAAVLFVSLGRQRERARITAFKQQMRTLVPSITTCIDDGGELQDTVSTAGSEEDICSTSSNHGVHLEDTQMVDCDGEGSYTITADNTAGSESFTGECNLTGGGICTAVCDVQGCEYTDCN